MPQVLALILICMLVLMVVQHLRFMRYRRVLAQDRQNPWHRSDAFHILVFFRVKKGQRVINAASQFVERLVPTGAKLIYGGQAAFSVDSEQLGEQSWDGVLLLQYRNRFVYQEQE